MKNLLYGVTIILFYQTTFLGAQPQKSILDQLSEGERKTIEALALYPEDIRIAILQVAQHPSLLAKTKRLQDISREKFRNLLAGIPQVTQEAFWDLTRYHGLIDRIVLTNNESQSIDEVLKDYPTIIHQRVKQLYQSEAALFADIAELNTQSRALENEIYQKEPADLQTSLRTLLDNPDVLTILLEEMELTILVGDLYTERPDWVLLKADSLHHEMARQNAQELADWRIAVEQDPQTQDELRASMSTYQENYPYDDLYAESAEWDQNAGPSDDNIVQEIPDYFYYPYSFWYGYPYWYDYPRWRVFPYWYDWGLFPIPHLHPIITGLPRYHVISWYFNRPQHHYRFHHLSTTFINHYRGHRSFGSGISAGVKSWQQANKDIITDDFLADKQKLSENIRQYGAMEKARAVYNRKHPEKEQSAKAFVARKSVKYGDLRQTPTAKIQPKESTRATRPLPRPNQQEEVTRPAVKTREQIRTIDKAKEYHRNQWTKRPPVQASPPQPATRQKEIRPAPDKSKSAPVRRKVP